MSALVTVKSYTTRIDAEIDKGFLESQSIKSEIIADDAGGMQPFPLSYKFGVELKVLERDLKKAKELLDRNK